MNYMGSEGIKSSKIGSKCESIWGKEHEKTMAKPIRNGFGGVAYVVVSEICVSTAWMVGSWGCCCWHYPCLLESISVRSES